MPLYDYKCKNCGRIFEVRQKMTEEPLKKCPQCNGEVHRLMSAAGIVFKGSGFHVTDYKKTSKPEKAASKLTSNNKPQTSKQPPTEKPKI